MQFKDYYKILEVEPTATADQIKKSYRRLAMTYHPDRNPGNAEAEEKFKEINEAYDVLSNAEKRAKFDLMRDGKNNPQDYYSRTSTKTSTSADTDDGPDFDFEYFKRKTGEYSEFFKNFFNKSSLFKGDDFTGTITISLLEAYTGSKRILNVLDNKLRITIQPGIKHDQLLKIPEQGYPGIAGGKKGDLYVRVKIDPDKMFTRRGDELFTEVYVDIFTVMVGGTVTIRTMSGDVRITVPKGIEYGKQLRIRGKGMPVYGADGLFGDLFVKVKYYIPSDFSDDEVAAIKKMQEKRMQKN